ncbi:MAG: hypothetical protein AAGF20_00330 [Pseudomonadota bacterium]
MTRACRAPVRAAIGDAFSDEEIDEALDGLKARFKRKRASGLDEDAALEAAREEALQDALLADAIDRRNKMFAALAKKDRAQFFGEDGESDPRRLSAFLVGDEETIDRGALSVDAMSRAYATQIWTQMFHELDAAGLLERVTDPFNFGDTREFQGKVAREMSRLKGRSDLPATGDDEALKVAYAFVRGLDRAKKLQNENGAWIRELPGYVARQTHDPLKMTGGFFKGMTKAAQAKAKAKWVDFILPLLDEETFANIDDATPAGRRTHLELIWSNIVAGDHLHGSNTVYDLDGFKPPPSKARSVSAHRVLHFKGPDEWLAYNSQYGQGSLFDAVIGQIDRGGRNAALMRAFGPSPEAAFDAMKKRGVEQAKQAGRADDAKELAGWKMQARFDEVSGAASAPESNRLAALSRAIRQQQSLSKLGGMVLSAVTDVTLGADTLKRAGVDYLQGYDWITKSVSGLSGDARIEAARILGATTRIMAGEVSSRFNPLDGANGVMGRLTAIFYKVNGFTIYQNRVRRGAAAALSANLGGKARLAWDGLDAPTKDTLQRFGIEAGLWNTLRSYAEDLGGDDGLFLTLSAVDQADPKRLAKALAMNSDSPRALDRAVTEARLRLQTYFLTLTDDALTEPRARERAILRVGTSTGTPAGFFAELLTQFKSFPTSVVLRHTAPAGRRAFAGDGLALAHLMIGGMALGYLAIQMKQIARLREPRPLDGQMVIASLLQGGGLGIYGDFLMADFNRYGRSALATLGGPAVGELEGLLGLMSAVRSGDDPSARLIRFASGNVPFANLFYTRAALDYMLLYRLQEAASPGYLRRYEQRVEDETGADFILSPRAAE